MKQINNNNKQNFNNDYYNFYKLLHGKTNYLKNLVNKKNEIIKIVDNQRKEILKDSIFGKNKFERDYSVFSSNNKFRNIIPKKPTQKFFFSPNQKITFLSPEDNENLDKYKIKVFSTDDFSNMYKYGNIKNFPSTPPTKMINKTTYKNMKKIAIRYDDEKNEEIHFDNNYGRYFNNSSIYNCSRTTRHSSTFLTGVGSKVLNPQKKIIDGLYHFPTYKKNNDNL